jgi:peptide/nickel transport system substrate-binding protein
MAPEHVAIVTRTPSASGKDELMRRRQSTAALSGIAALALVATACGSSSSGGTQGGGAPNAPAGNGSSTFVKYSQNAGGTPVKGGVLNVLGTGDVDFLDPNITYYTLGSAVSRLVNRGLYSYPGTTPGKTTTAEPDLATGLPQISADGKTYTVTIKQGAMWNTTPARQVSAADVIRGLQISCNPSQPFGGAPDYDFLVKGYISFCNAFAKVKPTVAAIKAFVNSHTIAGVTVGSTPETVVFHLTQPATYFTDELTLSPFHPRPVEELSYLPGSVQLAQNIVSDGPYIVKSYNPAHTLDFTRNPAFSASNDPLLHAYVDEIKINETGNESGIQQQLLTSTPTADTAFGNGPPSSDVPGLISSNNPNLNVQSLIGNDYLVYNTVDPNNNGALKKVAVRQALNYAMNRTALIQVEGGPKVSPPLSHVLPPQVNGSQNYDPYPYNPTKAKQLLASAGVKNLTLKFLYASGSTTNAKQFQVIQGELSQVGVTAKPLVVPDADKFTKYLEVPSNDRRGVFDVAFTGWLPDWYGEAALSFFTPLFDGRALPPNSSNFGLYNDPITNTLIDKAKAATSVAQAHSFWNQADHQVMKDAAIYPIDDANQPLMHGSQVHNNVYVEAIQNFDWSNEWLDPSKNGG